MNVKAENDKDVKIIVATHKKYQMPKDDIYIPLQVNAEKNEKKHSPSGSLCFVFALC